MALYSIKFVQKGKKKNFATKKYYQWKILRNRFWKLKQAYGPILFRKKKIEIYPMSLLEIHEKLCSLFPSNFMLRANYGENMVNYIQENEINLTVNYLKIFFLKKCHFSIFLKIFIYNLFLNPVQNNPEHVHSLLNVKINAFILMILVKIFLKKKSNRFFRIENSKLRGYFLKKFLNDQKIFNNRIISISRNFIFSSNIKRKPKKIFKFFPDLSFKHSFGSFQVFHLEKLSLILEYRGIRIKKKFKNKVETSNRGRDCDLFFFELNSSLTIDATFLGNQSRLINHGCRSNCFTRNFRHGYKNFVLLLSKQNLKILEELSYDYRINADDYDEDQIQCNCFNFECKKELII